jgi:ubiquitin-activating enzyme E1
VSGKFHPIAQHFYFDCREILLENVHINNPGSNNAMLNRYSSQIAIFGKEFQEKLLNTKCFLVGSGALGCEYLKNFAMLGLCCGKNGLLTVTDMDTIEKSNLNRQFLFRSWDIQKSKAEVASRAAKKMNPEINVQPNLNRVSKETAHIYNESFFNSLDVVCNALDNVAARLYVDSCCVEFKKPLIESGTLGSQGNVQGI